MKEWYEGQMDMAYKPIGLEESGVDILGMV
jgi:hypothetical protein